MVIIMYNPLLDTFIAVADYGSFTRAAQHLYISPTAVMKQINALESHLNLKLIERTRSGVHVTPAGEVIYQDAKFVIDYSKKSIAAANAATHTYDTTFCVGTSLLNPAKPFMDLWYRVNQTFPDYKLHLVPFEDDHEGILSEIEKLGEKFDFLIGVCDSKAWLSLCQFLPLGRYKKMIAVSREHPLASKIPLRFMIYRYLTAVRKQAMFCLRLNAGRRFIPDWFPFRSTGITAFLMACFIALTHRRMCFNLSGQ